MAHCRGSHAGTPSHREAGLRIALLEVYIEVEIPPLGMRMCSMLLRGDGPPMKDQTPHKVLSHIRDAAFRRHGRNMEALRGTRMRETHVMVL